MELVVRGRAIRTSAEHPFWVRDKGWTAAQQLVVVDQLRGHDGRWVALESASSTGEAVSLPVFNFRVADSANGTVCFGLGCVAEVVHNRFAITRVISGRPGSGFSTPLGVR